MRISASSSSKKTTSHSKKPLRPPLKKNVQDTAVGPNKLKLKFHLFSVRLGLNMVFLFLVMLLVIIGTLMMFSASYPSGYAYKGNSFYYLNRQLIFVAVGTAVMIGASYFDYRILSGKLTFIIYLIAFLALAAVLVIPTDSDVKRWIYIGSFSIQPSEIAKFAIILFVAQMGTSNVKEMGTFKYGVLPSLLAMVVVCVLLFFEPHYSGIAIILVLTALMLFISGAKIRYFLGLGALLVVGVVILAVTGKLGYAMSRMHGLGQALIYTTDEMWQDTYQTRNSLYAIGSGGFWGQGIGMSRQKYLYIPEVQNDFVFAVVCEELGFIGAVIILIIFALLVWRGIKISLNTNDRFGALLGVGLSAQIGIQVILNILVITDWMPNTGISLPFFSYGGSSLIMLMAQMGLVLSVSRTAHLEKA